MIGWVLKKFMMASTKRALEKLHRDPEFKANIAAYNYTSKELERKIKDFEKKYGHKPGRFKDYEKSTGKKNYGGPFMGIDDNIENTNEETTKNVEAVKVDNLPNLEVKEEIKDNPKQVNTNSIEELSESLTKLGELKEKGLLTEEEFNEQKKKLLKQ